jgi:hypothetical protein
MENKGQRFHAVALLLGLLLLQLVLASPQAQAITASVCSSTARYDTTCHLSSATKRLASSPDRRYPPTTTWEASAVARACWK